MPQSFKNYRSLEFMDKEAIIKNQTCAPALDCLTHVQNVLDNGNY